MTRTLFIFGAVVLTAAAFAGLLPLWYVVVVVVCFVAAVMDRRGSGRRKCP
jgi:hypothetical protein